MDNGIVAKIRQGTRSDSTDLCKSCSRSVIRTGGRDSDEERYCNMFESRVTRRVAECSGYYNSSLPSLKDLYDTAWIVSTDKHTKQIGFSPYSKWKQKNEVPDDYYLD